VRDWVQWHHAYDDSLSALAARLECVKLRLGRAIDQAPPGPVQLLSLCAGQGRDVIGVLPDHRRRDDVRAVLVELNEHNAELAVLGAARAGLDQVLVREADAGEIENFADAVPADVLLLCGIFGNISEADIEHTVGAASSLCAPGATVIWTRHRRPPDLTPRIREWFAAGGFDEVAFDALDTASMTGVGTHRFSRSNTSALPAGRLFSFEPEEAGTASRPSDTPARRDRDDAGS
jgi:hypothetical protein